MKKTGKWRPAAPLRILFLLSALLLGSFLLPAPSQAAVKLSKTSLSLVVGKKATLKVTGTKKKVTWSSSNKKIAAVSSKGVVTGKKAGSAKITAKVGAKKYTCKVKVTKKASSAAKVTYTTYKHEYFTASVPKGWKVQIGQMGLYHHPIDIISYGIRVYDPKNTDRCVYLNLNAVALKSEEARSRQEFYYNWYGTENFKILSELPIVTHTTTKGFFGDVQSLYGMKGFSVLKNLGKEASGGDILYASSTSLASGKKLNGLYTAYVTADPYTDYVSAYSIVMERARSGEFEKWLPVLDHILGSIKFTSKFHTDRKEQWKKINAEASYQYVEGEQLRGRIMEAWDKMMN